jgi:hypothetical protein
MPQEKSPGALLMLVNKFLPVGYDSNPRAGQQ